VDLTELGRSLALPDLPHTMSCVEHLARGLIESGEASLAEPSLRIFNGPGKRLRPALTLTAAACGNRFSPDEALLHACAAVELVHTATLIHDDIMDGAHNRRGVASINAQEGPDVALLCGDYLLALAGFAGATASRTIGREIARTITAVCEGQIQELNESFNPLRSPDSIIRAMEGKTAALIRTACYVGGLCGNLPPSGVDALSAYGHAFGVAFQIVDDVLDFVSSRELSGKPVMNDLRSGVYTLPVAFARTGELGRELVGVLRPVPEPKASEHASGRMSLDEVRVERAVAILRSGNHLRRAVDLARAYAETAARGLTSVLDGPTARGLARLPGFYVEDQLRRKAGDGILGRELTGWLPSEEAGGLSHPGSVALP
jgi:geranylgeranyl pyrophosphate synthase